MKSCSYPGRSRNLGLGFEYNSIILRVLRFWEKGQDGEKQQNTLKKAGPQSKDLNVRAKTDFLLLTEKKKRKRRGGGRGQIRTIFTFHTLLGTFQNFLYRLAKHLGRYAISPVKEFRPKEKGSPTAEQIPRRGFIQGTFFHGLSMD